MWQLNDYIYKEICLNVKILRLVYSNNTSQTLLSTAQEPYMDISYLKHSR